MAGEGAKPPIGEKAPEPTICVECKHYHCYDEDPNLFPMIAACMASRVEDIECVDYITGEKTHGPKNLSYWTDWSCTPCARYYDCEEINTSGNCPKFEKKE